MLEVIQFIFSDLLHFIGFIILLGVIFNGIADIVKAWKKNS
jgi:hypothetical protein